MSKQRVVMAAAYMIGGSGSERWYVLHHTTAAAAPKPALRLEEGINLAALAEYIVLWSSFSVAVRSIVKDVARTALVKTVPKMDRSCSTNEVTSHVTSAVMFSKVEFNRK